MKETIEIVGAKVNVTPDMVAAMFWNMDSSQQADFFAAIERLAGPRLCMQMAYVVEDIAERADNGDRDAQNGFQTMLSHAQGYVESAIGIRHWKAKHEISRMAKAITEAA